MIQNIKLELIRKNYSWTIFYFTFFNLGALKNIVLKLKNNIERVSAGTMYSIISELINDGILAKIKCI